MCTMLATDERTDRRTDEGTEGQLENIMYPPASLAWRRHTKWVLGQNLGSWASFPADDNQCVSAI